MCMISVEDEDHFQSSSTESKLNCVKSTDVTLLTLWLSGGNCLSEEKRKRKSQIRNCFIIRLYEDLEHERFHIKVTLKPR